MKNKNSTNTQKQIKQNKNNMLRKKQYKRSDRAKALNPEKKKRKADIKMLQKECRICLKEVMGFLNISMFLHTRLATETHPADGQFLQVALNREEFLKLRRRN